MVGRVPDSGMKTVSRDSSPMPSREGRGVAVELDDIQVALSGLLEYISYELCQLSLSDGHCGWRKGAKTDREDRTK